MLFHIAKLHVQWEPRLTHGNGIMRKTVEGLLHVSKKKEKKIKYILKNKKMQSSDMQI